MLHRAVALSDGEELHLDMPDQPKRPPPLGSLPPAELAAQELPLPDNLQDYLDTQERHILGRALHETRYNRTAAAHKLGMSLRQIRYRIARLNIAMPDGDTHADGGESAGDRVGDGTNDRP